MDKVSIQPPIHSKYIFRICLGFTAMGTALLFISSAVFVAVFVCIGFINSFHH